MKQKIQERIEFFSLFIKPTTTDKMQFETNCRNVFMTHQLSKRIDTIDKHFLCIGKEVYRFKNDMTVVLKEDYKPDVFNKIYEESVIYDVESFELFQKKYIQYQIEYLTNDLVTRSITSNSTNKFSNLEFEWILECKQELIKFFNELLGNQTF